MEAYLGLAIPVNHRAINILTRHEATSNLLRYTAFTTRDSDIQRNHLLLELHPNSNWRGDVVVMKHLNDNDFQFANVTEHDFDIILACLRDITI